MLPLGCFQKGRSRTWLDDHLWWVGVIEFQPSAWSKGSYLNVGACWLWYEKDYLSFDDGYRVESFHQFETVEQFTGCARLLAECAKEEVLKLRERFPTIQHTAAYLRNTIRNTIWDHYHAAVSAGLIGDVATARSRFAAVATEKHEFAWVQDLKKRTAGLARVVDDTVRFRGRIASVVARTRTLLKLPKCQLGALFDP
ncbi:MAG: hypothetical protein HY706_13910 [Candidatus Hydrogenedentes bacterium]|nr:hypothetical protein [Candidatus Hydrogenedentota bacterium]